MRNSYTSYKADKNTIELLGEFILLGTRLFLSKGLTQTLGFSDPKYLCPTLGACASGGRPFVL